MLGNIICRCSNGEEHNYENVHQIELVTEGETFYICPWGNAIRVIANKKTELEPALNGVTVYVAETEAKPEPKEEHGFDFSSNGNSLTIKRNE